MSINTETVGKKFASCLEITLPISNTQKMQKLEEHIYHIKVDIYKGCHGSIQCWKRLMTTVMNHSIDSFTCYDCL